MAISSLLSALTTIPLITTITSGGSTLTSTIGSTTVFTESLTTLISPQTSSPATDNPITTSTVVTTITSGGSTLTSTISTTTIFSAASGVAGSVVSSSGSTAPSSSIPTPSQSSASASSISSSTPFSTQGSSGLSTGAKIGIGVAVPLAVLAASLFLYLWLRRRKRNLKVESEAPSSSLEKPELHGSPFDPAIAGPVKSKSELATGRPRLDMENKESAMTRSSELPAGNAGANAPWAHSELGYLPPELSHNQAADGHEHGAGSQDKNRDSRSPVQRKAAPTQSSSSATAIEPDDHHSLSRRADLVTEADLLVQELGLISMRKKAIISSANAQGRQPEDLEGENGEDWRDLLKREQRLRQKLEEIEKTRTRVS